MHQEVIENLESIHGALLGMNRSIQAEGTFGIIKNDGWYKRIVRRWIESVRMEIFLVSIGHNLYKYLRPSTMPMVSMSFQVCLCRQILRCETGQFIIPMIDGCNPGHRLVGDGFRSSFLLFLWQCLYGLCKTASHMSPAG